MSDEIHNTPGLLWWCSPGSTMEGQLLVQRMLAMMTMSRVAGVSALLIAVFVGDMAMASVMVGVEVAAVVGMTAGGW